MTSLPLPLINFLKSDSSTFGKGSDPNKNPSRESNISRNYVSEDVMRTGQESPACS